MSNSFCSFEFRKILFGIKFQIYIHAFIHSDPNNGSSWKNVVKNKMETRTWPLTFFSQLAQSKCECWKIRIHEKPENNLPRPLNVSLPLTTNAFLEVSSDRHVWHFSTTAAVPFAPWVALPETHAHYQCVSSNESSTSLGRSKFLKGLHLLSRKRDMNRKFRFLLACQSIHVVLVVSIVIHDW